MLKFILSGLTVLTLFIFSANTYSQYNMVMYSYYAPLPESNVDASAHMGITHRGGTMGSTTVETSAYTGLPGVEKPAYYQYFESTPQRAKAEYVHTETYVVTSREPSFVTYRRYVRPSDLETQDVYLAPMDVPVVSSTRTSIGVAPYGYKYYTKNTNEPIRDFRTDIWQTKTYSAASEKHVLYDDVYGSVYVDPNE